MKITSEMPYFKTIAFVELFPKGYIHWFDSVSNMPNGYYQSNGEKWVYADGANGTLDLRNEKYVHASWALLPSVLSGSG